MSDAVVLKVFDVSDWHAPPREEGTITVEGTTFTCDPEGMQMYLSRPLALGIAKEHWLEFLDGWSNGYTSIINEANVATFLGQWRGKD
jgi:hypothetical protein